MKILLFAGGMIAFTVVANVLLKMGAVAGHEAGGPWWMQVANWRVASAYGSYAISVLFYTLLLRTVPLNVAQSFTAAQFIAVIIASASILSEPISTPRWAGIALIAAGIALVGWTYDPID
jgi:drug/metabolite transporter (DMT)-like permease